MSARIAFIILPTQLYHTHSIPLKDYDVFVVEEPAYYFDKVFKPFKANKAKLAFLHACINAYCK